MKVTTEKDAQIKVTFADARVERFRQGPLDKLILSMNINGREDHEAFDVSEVTANLSPSMGQHYIRNFIREGIEYAFEQMIRRVTSRCGIDEVSRKLTEEITGRPWEPLPRAGDPPGAEAQA